MRVTMVVALGCLPCQAQLPTGWSGIDIGVGAAGSDAYASGVYTIAGGGTGIGNPSDQMHFTYTTISAGGNFKLTCRVASFNGTNGSEVGLTVRQGTGTTGSIGAVAYRPAAGTGTNPNNFAVYSRNTQTGALYPWYANSNNSPMAAPCYLQLVRYGNNFAAYKSTDGIFWTQILNSSGGVFSATGAIQVGFFVASGGSGTATATIDTVNLNTSPLLTYETSWLGNSFSDDYNGYVSGCATALWVGSDGTCYEVGFWDEAGEDGKIYKNGKVTGEFGLPASSSYEGAITGDGTHLYYAGAIVQRALYQTDLTAGNNSNTHQMYLQTQIVDPTSGALDITGLACGNGELYISDALTSQVLVANPSQTNFGVASYAPNTTVTNTIDTSGVTNPAPQSVYQSAFYCDLIYMTIPGLAANTSYNVRLDLAELNPNDNAVGKRIMNLYAGGQEVAGYDIYAATGALYKAAAVSFTGVTTDGSGNLWVAAQRGTGTQDGWAILNGIEILNSNGTTAELINCGGTSTGAWQSTINEIPSRAFSVTRPGPIAVDKNGNLWIVQEGTTFPATQNFTYQSGWAAIKLYDKNGNYLNKQITDVVSPTALSYNSTTDQLLVAENGPAQNIRVYSVYSGTTTAAACTSTLGVSGGVFAGSTPGLIHDPASGGDARLFGPTGVGQDSSGNIYVAGDSGENQTDLRSFTSTGALNWSLFGLEMTTTGDFDPTLSASDIWTTTHHYAMNYSGSTAGSEWTLKSYTVNPISSYPLASNLGGGAAMYRRINGTPFLFTSGQGQIGTINIYRFNGEQLVPCGSVSNGDNHITDFWTDANGDGIQQAGEVTTAPTYSWANFMTFDVDSSGNLYLGMGGTSQPTPSVEKFPCQGLNSVGAPMYSMSYTDVPAPAPFTTTWGNYARLRYVGGALDTMYLEGDTYPGASNLNKGGTLACYDHWNSSPTKRFVTVLPDPSTSTNFVNGAPPYNDYEGFFYNAFDVANGVAFCSDEWGTIRVVDPVGNLVTNLVPGPEVSGGNAWEDEAMGVRAHYNPALGEYDILQENSGFRVKENFYRVNTLGPFLTSLDIGSVAVAGSSALSNGVFTVKGDGADIWGTADAFQYDYQGLTGNGTIIARVTGVSNTNVWAKAGVMIRETLTAGSREASILMTPSTTDGATYQWRSATGGSSSNTDKSGIAPTYWVKLVRSGNVFTGYFSPNGTTWTQVGSAETISMASTAYVGLAVTSHNNVSPLCTATFDNVKITSP